MSLTQFARYNMLGAAVWAPLVGGLGYVLGDALQMLLGDIRRYEEIALSAIVVVAILFALLRRWKRSRGSPRR